MVRCEAMALLHKHLEIGNTMSCPVWTAQGFICGRNTNCQNNDRLYSQPRSPFLAFPRNTHAFISLPCNTHAFVSRFLPCLATRMHPSHASCALSTLTFACIHLSTLAFAYIHLTFLVLSAPSRFAVLDHLTGRRQQKRAGSARDLLCAGDIAHRSCCP